MWLPEEKKRKKKEKITKKKSDLFTDFCAISEII